MKTETENSNIPSVLVVIVNYNGSRHICRCLESVFRQTYLAQCIVVDNDSRDGSLAIVRKDFPQTTIIEMGYNAGWGIAVNAGMAHSASDYIVLLNNDIYLDDRCIEEMVKAIESARSYGSCASRILLWDDPKKIDVCGVDIYRDGLSCARGRLLPADTFKEPQEVFCASDCCCLYRREMIEDIGDYDPDFFLYADDTDMGWRHQIAGWRCIYAPGAVAYHAHSHAAGSYSGLKAFYVERNRIYLCMKYFPPSAFIMSFFYAAYRYCLQLVNALFHHRGALSHYRKEYPIYSGLFIILKAYCSALAHAHIMLRRRLQMRRIRRLSKRQIYQLLVRYSVSTQEVSRYE